MQETLVAARDGRPTQNPYEDGAGLLTVTPGNRDELPTPYKGLGVGAWGRDCKRPSAPGPLPQSLPLLNAPHRRQDPGQQGKGGPGGQEAQEKENGVAKGPRQQPP